MHYASIDIGSTWTKGALFTLCDGQIRSLNRAAHPTTVHDLAEGFDAVLHEITREITQNTTQNATKSTTKSALQQIAAGELSLQYSSSAKGGLAVAAIGLVPEITLELGKVAAQSAGAKLTDVFAYQLTRRDIAQLEKSPPDILLFAGGTDGGNSAYVRANAQMLAESALDCEILYAGNRALADEVAECLHAKRLTLVENLLPTFNEPQPEPARQAIRAIFLQTIVKGKGLDRIVTKTGASPLPTPLVVLDYARAIHQHVAGWENFILLDMGGATTDVYSAHREAPEAGTILKGLPEPVLKRTVEGDLGMRVSAEVTCRTGKAYFAEEESDKDGAYAALCRYAKRVFNAPEYIPSNAKDCAFDSQLAGICLAEACMRHAGRHTRVYTADGERQLQTGRDLRSVQQVIGAGGWLAHAADFSPATWLSKQAFDARERAILLPRDFTYWRDEEGLFPLLANLARVLPKEAALAGIKALKR